MVVVGSDNVKLLLEQSKECPVLKYVITIDHAVPEDISTLAKERNIEIRMFNEIIVSLM